jgi:hypothetical protein
MAAGHKPIIALLPASMQCLADGQGLQGWIESDNLANQSRPGPVPEFMLATNSVTQAAEAFVVHQLLVHLFETKPARDTTPVMPYAMFQVRRRADRKILVISAGQDINIVGMHQHTLIACHR